MCKTDGSKPVGFAWFQHQISSVQTINSTLSYNYLHDFHGYKMRTMMEILKITAERMSKMNKSTLNQYISPSVEESDKQVYFHKS